MGFHPRPSDGNKSNGDDGKYSARQVFQVLLPVVDDSKERPGTSVLAQDPALLVSFPAITIHVCLGWVGGEGHSLQRAGASPAPS